MSTRKAAKVLAKRVPKRAQKRVDLPLGKNRIIGYARVSTVEQNLQMQIDALLRAGVHPDNLHVEKVSSVSARRPKLELALMDARDGDTFLVWKLDRFGRNVVDIYTKVEDLQKRGVTFKSLMDHFDTSTALGKAFFRHGGGIRYLGAGSDRGAHKARPPSGSRARLSTRRQAHHKCGKGAQDASDHDSSGCG